MKLNRSVEWEQSPTMLALRGTIPTITNNARVEGNYPDNNVKLATKGTITDDA